ncbi:MAG: hypothetical protein K0R21_1980, partial [Anaerocolumna sp.]|nr:hypothetical protein [Anaerocolumna sp.]
AYMFVYGRVDFVKLSGTADYIRLKYIYTWGFFYFIGKFTELSYEIKDPPGRMRMTRQGNLSLK